MFVVFQAVDATVLANHVATNDVGSEMMREGLKLSEKSIEQMQKVRSHEYEYWPHRTHS